jgi:hypothetical protein
MTSTKKRLLILELVAWLRKQAAMELEDKKVVSIERAQKKKAEEEDREKVANKKLSVKERLRRGPQDVRRDIQVPLAPSGSRRVIPFAATVLRSLALLRQGSGASSHNDLTPLTRLSRALRLRFAFPGSSDGEAIEAKRKGKKVKIKPDGEGFEMEIFEDDGGEEKEAEADKPEAKEPDANAGNE